MAHERFGLLPRRFRLTHLLCQRLSDRLVEIHTHLVEGPFWELRVQFDSEAEAAEFSQVRTLNQLFSWFADRQDGDSIGKVLLPQLFVGLLGDMCQFVFEGLGSSARGKTGVAYALFRKPLKDNLFYLEWMLADPDAMIAAFFSSDAKQFALKAVASPDRARKVSEAACKKLITGIAMAPEHVWQLRFDKKAAFGLERHWQQALHLVTDHPDLKTRSREMNFIFHEQEDRLADWEHLYSTIPWLLIYAVEICESLTVIATGAPTPDARADWLHRSIGYMLWFGELSKWRRDEAVSGKELLAMGLQCPCGRPIHHASDFRKLFSDRAVTCPDCHEECTIEMLLQHFYPHSR